MPIIHYMPIVGSGVIRLEALSADPSVLDLLNDHQAEVYDKLLRQEACERIASTGLELSVNVFSRCFANRGFAGDISELLIKSGIEPRRLSLELVETEPLKECRIVRRNLARIAEMGVKLSIDDFGEGYATYERVSRILRRHTFHGLKANMSEMDAAAGLAALHGLELVVERIETPYECEEVIARGFLAQGYYIGKKFPIQDLPLWKESWSAREGA
jgi:EAL domain-containing protein (putative c-di-GMP-specific phosphodiesterase class I)